MAMAVPVHRSPVIRPFGCPGVSVADGQLVGRVSPRVGRAAEKVGEHFKRP
jgi:hypothetical protein